MTYAPYAKFLCIKIKPTENISVLRSLIGKMRLMTIHGLKVKPIQKTRLYIMTPSEYNQSLG